MKLCLKCNKTHEKSGKFCSRSCANSRVWSEKDKLKKSLSNKNSDKVKIANKIPRKKKSKNLKYWHTIECKICKINFDKLISSNRKTCSKKCARKILGGLRKNSGIGKSGWYKNYWLNSTYELAFVYYHLKHNIPIIRCEKIFTYICPLSNKERKYYPDFVVNNQIYEIKGYFDDIAKAKYNAANNIIVLLKTDLKNIFDYVEYDSGLKIKDLHILYNKE